MRRKRLSHTADILCQMFRGWRLIDSKPELVKFGSGLLEIDALTADCVFNKMPISQLPIAVEIREWLTEDLLAHNIAVESIASARLSVDLEFGILPWSQRMRTGEQFFSGEGTHVKTSQVHRCVMKCQSEIRTDEATYRAKLEDAQEWPFGWPA